jgi:uncharacterized protein (DUF433 family)
MEDELLRRITINPEIFGGKPIRGKRIAVEHVLGLLAAGSEFEEILEGYPQLEKADIQACLLYAYRISINDFSSCFGSWEDVRSAEKIINDIKRDAVNTRDIEEF